jgi:ribonuclease P protein component
VAGRNSQHDEKLRRCERITDEYEYKQVIHNGRLVRSTRFKAYVLKGESLERKAGFVAGKRVGSAWRRNRAKRLLKEAYRHLKCRLRKDGFKVIFVARKATAESAAADIQKDMARVFEEWGLLNGVR